jgi:hypothetical protein
MKKFFLLLGLAFMMACSSAPVTSVEDAIDSCMVDTCTAVVDTCVKTIVPVTIDTIVVVKK